MDSTVMEFSRPEYWVALPFSRGSSQSRDRTQVYHGRWILCQLRDLGSPGILEWVAYPFSRGSSCLRKWTGVSCITGRFFFFLNYIYLFIYWRLITLQYCSEFCHTLKWISHGFTCILHPDPLSHLPLPLIPLGLPSAPGLSSCLMHPTWAGGLFHPR